jgi:exopolysaccharide biosynthesis WecB/TagA/CpsF family protein
VRFKTCSGDISITHETRTALFAAVKTALLAKTGFALATLNLDHLVKLVHDQKFAVAYGRHDMIVADGNPIVWLNRLAGQDIELLPGSDLVLPLARLAAETDTPIALLGSTDATLTDTARAMQADIAGLKVGFSVAPPFGFDPSGPEAIALLRQLHTSGAGLCFLALGAPKQEILASLGRKHAPNVGFISIGAGLDFIAGSQKRAPRVVRALAMEWLWRLLSNPARLAARYARCFAILPGLIFSARKQRK